MQLPTCSSTDKSLQTSQVRVHLTAAGIPCAFFFTNYTIQWWISNPYNCLQCTTILSTSKKKKLIGGTVYEATRITKMSAERYHSSTGRQESCSCVIFLELQDFCTYQQWLDKLDKAKHSRTIKSEVQLDSNPPSSFMHKPAKSRCLMH